MRAANCLQFMAIGQGIVQSKRDAAILLFLKTFNFSTLNLKV